MPDRKAPHVLCDGCGEMVPASCCETVAGWTICNACRSVPADENPRAASGYEHASQHSPWWWQWGGHKGMN